MALTTEDIARLPVPVIRAALPDWVAGHVAAPPEVLEPLRASVAERAARASDDEVAAMQATFVGAGEEYRLYPADPFAREITRRFMSVLTPTWEIRGREHLDSFLALGPGRRMIIANHLSYTDTQVTDVIFSKDGLTPLADRLVAIAGPKVYTEPWRRMAAIALNTRKTAQSGSVASEQEVLPPRELARIAFECIEECGRLMDQGMVVLLYPEGRRSRTGRLQPFLKAAHRYAGIADAQILVMAQTGTEKIYPVGEGPMFPGHVDIAFAEPFVGADFPGRTGALLESHRRLASLLPEERQPVEGAIA